MTKKELIKLIQDAQALHAQSIILADTDEEASDKAYTEYWEMNRKIADWIRTFSMGMIDEKTALQMTVHKKGEVLELAKKWRGF